MGKRIKDIFWRMVHGQDVSFREHIDPLLKEYQDRSVPIEQRSFTLERDVEQILKFYQQARDGYEKDIQSPFWRNTHKSHVELWFITLELLLTTAAEENVKLSDDFVRRHKDVEVGRYDLIPSDACDYLFDKEYRNDPAHWKFSGVPFAELVRQNYKFKSEPHDVRPKRYPYHLTDEEKDNMTKYTPSGTLPANKHFTLLREQKVIDSEMTNKDFKDNLIRANFGEMYKWANENRCKTKFREYIDGVARKYFKSLPEYAEHAAESMGLTRQQLGKHDHPDKGFSKKLEEEI